jgi:predicted enzyme related to lactoylglutathione lyase
MMSGLVMLSFILNLSEDIEADLKAIKAKGGKALMPKIEIPNVGYFAMFTDPTGNMLALYTSMNPA